MRDSIKSIQFLRFIAASMVVFAHSMQATIESIGGDRSSGMLHVANFGGSGVHIFFVISGFIMVYSSFGVGVRHFDSFHFILRRLIRIFPIYWVCAAAYFILHRTFWDGYSLSIWDAIGSVLLLPGYSSLIIGQGWTLSYELYFYICFAGFMILGLLRGLAALTTFFLAAIAVGVLLHSDNEGLRLVTNSLLVEFLAGAWIAYFFVRQVCLSSVHSRTLVLTALIIFMGGLAFGYHRLVLMWGVPSTLLIAGCVFMERGGTLPHFAQKWAYLGDSSYSLYLIHYLMISVLPNAFFMPFSNPAYSVAFSLVYTFMCVLIAIVLYELVERRMVLSLQGMARFIQRPGKPQLNEVSS